MVNIERLLKHVQDSILKTPTLSHFKVYIRNAEDAALIKAYLRSHYPNVELLLLEADIMRAELLVEVEAVARLD